MGPSRIFTLVSNKRQDFEMARFQLAQLYPDFLTRAPEHATRAMIVALEGYISRERNADEWHDKKNEQTFMFDNYVAHFRRVLVRFGIQVRPRARRSTPNPVRLFRLAGVDPRRHRTRGHCNQRCSRSRTE